MLRIKDLQRAITLNELAPSPYFSIIKVHLVDINVFAKFYEIPSLPFQDIEKPKCRTDWQTDGQRENSIPHPHVYNDLCAQQRLRSDWASAKSDQSLRCPHEETLGPLLPIECTAKALIRLGGCPGWSDWVDAQADLSLRCVHRSFCCFCHAQAHIRGVPMMIYSYI